MNPSACWLAMPAVYEKNCFCNIKMIIAAAMNENKMEPPPSSLREFLINLMPMAKTATVIAMRTSDMAIIAIQYNTSNSDAVSKT